MRKLFNKLVFSNELLNLSLIVVFFLCVISISCIKASNLTIRHHGNKTNELHGGSCKEFLRLNNLSECCRERDDECYMIHYDTRCYCDKFCDRSTLKEESSDCCPDADVICQPPKTCYYDNKIYQHKEVFYENCRKCVCDDGKNDCFPTKCAIETDIIEEINSNKNSTWTAKHYNHLKNVTLDHAFNHYLGVDLPASNQTAFDGYEQINMKNFNFYEHNKQPFRIQNQQDCNASWLYSSLDVANDRARKIYNASINFQPPFQIFSKCNKKYECKPVKSDQGWNMLKNLSIKGIVTEKCFQSTSFHDSSCSEKNYCPGSDVYLKVSHSYPVDFKNVMNEIYSNGPVQMLFKVYQDFFMYQEGVYSTRNEREPFVHHSVKVFGWGQVKEKKFWHAANSWGKEWGQNGTFEIEQNEKTQRFFGVISEYVINGKKKKTSRKFKNYHRKLF